VSLDFFYGGSWNIGSSSLLVAALGKAPSKDTFWSSDNGNQSTSRGGCDKRGCPPDHSSPAAVLHTMLAVLSTGPVGFSDAPGETNASLILRTCDAGGNLLQPSRPITAVDSTQDSTPGAAPAGFVLGTHTASGSSVLQHLVLAHQLTAPFTVRALDFWPALQPGAAYVAADWTALQACASGSLLSDCSGRAVTAPASSQGSVLQLQPYANGTDSFSPSLTLLSPVCSASGAALLGEFPKMAPVSTLRFPGPVSCGGSAPSAALSFLISGLPAEQVQLAFTVGQAIFKGSFGFPAASAARASAGRATAECSVSSAGLLSCV
jgi:hypothetical protein